MDPRIREDDGEERSVVLTGGGDPSGMRWAPASARVTVKKSVVPAQAGSIRDEIGPRIREGDG
jgi:hypothetical protein